MTFCPKFNKVLIANYRNNSNKRRGTYSGKYGTKMYHYGFKCRPQISAAFLEKKINELRYISLCTV